MNKEELDYNIRVCASDLNVDEKYVRPIPKNELVVGKEYIGNCRNSNKAVWKGDHFEYQRYKFENYYFLYELLKQIYILYLLLNIIAY